MALSGDKVTDPWVKCGGLDSPNFSFHVKLNVTSIY